MTVTMNDSFTISLSSSIDEREKDTMTEKLFLFNSSNTLLFNLFNDTDLTFYELGPRHDSLYIIVPITIIYMSILFTGIIGNVITCVVIARNKSMHTTTNYYLFSLAISDLLLLVSGLPAEIYLIWFKYPYAFGEGFCILRGLAAETSTNATVLTITAFTIERYVAICHPFLSQTMSKLSRAVKLILFIWLIALSSAIPQALQFGIVEDPDRGSDYVACTYKTVIVEHSFELSTFLFFVIPMILIAVLYALIGLKLRKSNMMEMNSGKSGNCKFSGSTMRSRSCRHYTRQSSRRVIRMLVAVVVAFFICWAPFHVQRLIAVYGTNSVDHISSNSPWMEFLYLLFTYVSGVFYYVSTTINPILYNIMSNKFREAFVSLLRSKKSTAETRRCISKMYYDKLSSNENNITDENANAQQMRMLNQQWQLLQQRSEFTTVITSAAAGCTK